MKWIIIVGGIVVGVFVLKSLLVRLLFHRITHEKCPKCKGQMCRRAS
jgi:hypothetical protein